MEKNLQANIIDRLREENQLLRSLNSELKNYAENFHKTALNLTNQLEKHANCEFDMFMVNHHKELLEMLHNHCESTIKILDVNPVFPFIRKVGMATTEGTDVRFFLECGHEHIIHLLDSESANMVAHATLELDCETCQYGENDELPPSHDPDMFAEPNEGDHADDHDYPGDEDIPPLSDGE